MRLYSNPETEHDSPSPVSDENNKLPGRRRHRRANDRKHITTYYV